ncbi:hypothetical protein ACVWZ6_003549 [Bradyrhizobium sp. GM6.1]
MIKTALDNFPRPPCAELLGWRLLDARPREGWIKLAFDGKPEFCNFFSAIRPASSRAACSRPCSTTRWAPPCW